jgi:hypothetical protein
LATGKAKRAAKILTSNQQQTLQVLALELRSLLEAGVMVQPNKVDFDVRKVLKRKNVSRDWMTLSIWAWRILHQKIRLRADVCFCAPVSSEDNAVIENFKDSTTLLRVNSKSKLSISP